jgi:hypothetical protein
MPRPIVTLLVVTVALSLSACSKNDDKGSLSIDMNSQAGAGNVSISVPGFDTKVKIPSSFMAHGDFDIDGVKLYPKSKVTSFNVNVDSKTTDGKSTDNSVVKMGFAAPADVATVTTWYKDQFAAKSIAARQTATGFSGKTEDGDVFTIALMPVGAGATNGAIQVVDAK